MERNDRQAIEGLFDKLAGVERQAPPRDDEADAFIRERIAAQPGAPYFMAQTIVVQEQALNAAQARIETLEREAASGSGGGLLSGLFGDRKPARSSVPSVGRATPPPPPPGARGQAPGHRGGGFLAGAAQTAMGVAGGVLLGNAIAGMFAGDEAHAAEPPAEDPGVDEAALDDGGFDAGGFDDDLGF